MQNNVNIDLCSHWQDAPRMCSMVQVQPIYDTSGSPIGIYVCGLCDNTPISKRVNHEHK